MNVESVIIVGSGPAGYTAGIYAARANLAPLLVEGYQVGGQLMLTSDVENYPGFPEGVTGPDMMPLFRKQAERFGTRFIQKDVTRVDFNSSPLKVFCGEEEYQTKTVIVATGASAKWLGLESEQRLMAKGVSACATCDGAFFKDEKLIVIGGGEIPPWRKPLSLRALPVRLASFIGVINCVPPRLCKIGRIRIPKLILSGIVLWKKLSVTIESRASGLRI